MEQREMLGPTNCDLSQYTVNRENESNEDTEALHCRELLLRQWGLFNSCRG